MPSPTTSHKHRFDPFVEQILSAMPPEVRDDVLLTTEQVASWLQVSSQWLEIARQKNYGPKFRSLGPRCIRYTAGDVREFLQSRQRTHTDGRKKKEIRRKRKVSR